MPGIDRILAVRDAAAARGDRNLVNECNHALRRAGYSEPENTEHRAAETATPPKARKARS